MTFKTPFGYADAGAAEEDRVSKLPWRRWIANQLDAGLTRPIYGAPSTDWDQHPKWQRVAPRCLGSKWAPPVPGPPAGGVPARGPSPIAPAAPAAPRLPQTATDRDPRRMDPNSVTDLPGSLFHHSAFLTDDDARPRRRRLSQEAAYVTDSDGTGSMLIGGGNDTGMCGSAGTASKSDMALAAARSDAADLKRVAVR